MKRVLVALGVLLSLNLMSNPLSAQFGPPPGGRPPKDGGMPKFSPEDKEKFRQKLGISTQQQEQMDSLFEGMHKKRMELGKRLRELFEERDRVTDVYDFDRGKERSIRNEINKINSQLMAIHTEIEEKLRRILNSEQFQRLREMRVEQRKNWRKGFRRDDRGAPPPPESGASGH